MATEWTVDIVGQAKKSGKVLSRDAQAAFTTLLLEMRVLGPYRNNWPNYTKMKNKENEYHCHIEKGRPTYVACWRTFKMDKLIEVFYAGTHENAPY